MRRTPFIRFVSMLMAVLLLASSTGFVVVEHSCQMRGTTRSVWSGEKSCKPTCKAPAKPVKHARNGATHLSKQPCCQETSLLTRAEITATVQTVEGQEILFPVVNPIIHLVSLWVNGSSVVHAFYDELPYHRPLVHPVSRYIALLCIWLI